MKEARTPTSVLPLSIWWAANQNTAIWDRFMMSMTSGNIAAMVRPTLTWMSRREELVASKRAASWRSRAKARTTRMPVICSRTTRLRSSIRFCWRLNSGPIRETMSPAPMPSSTTATAMIHDRETSARIAMTTPTTIMMGAPMRTARVMKTSICTCWTSFVVRVMRDGAPNWLTSRAEKSRVRVKTASRMSRPIPMATWAARNTAMTWQIVCPRATASMRRECEVT